MNHYRICVYAISKNEERFVKTWAESMSEADKMIVLDTGSTDGTVEQLRACGAEVHTAHIDPWRFDTARNRSLALVPEDYDICVCTDLDERFHPGSLILSAGSFGCNLLCPFCQNHEISMAGDGALETVELSPEALADKALELRPHGNIGIAYTYNEPLVGYEYVRDCWPPSPSWSSPVPAL